ncbi:fimbria/pilus periplasmic chaperone [uncultured Cedecea sp.]|uniref:fimbria/pilus periplasmic chaperone n=1 Tax=uncultured Cedecea sp. TaxID=988762 RepID=UPI00261A9FD8|nr:fimbria/pilus periplasmic chaperone [uncultured Cedecea sp.]
MLTKLLTNGLCLIALCLPVAVQAIYIGDLTFSLPSDQEFVAKRIVNNNKSARLYQVSIIGIDSPSQQEVSTRPADGELLFAPRQLVLQAGQSEYYKFYYHGPKDNKERYYRVTFREIPTQHGEITNNNGKISLEPIITVDSIMVVRPREVNFKWHYDAASGTVANTGNTWFKLLIKPGCQTTEEEGDAYYVKPGKTVRVPALREKGNHFIVYNNKFIKISDSCPLPQDKFKDAE